MNIAFVGGREFDATELTALLASVPPADTVVVGSGIGSEKFIREQARELGLNLLIPDLRPDLFGDGALGCQVNSVFVAALHGKLILINASSSRVKIAKQIIERSKAWPMEVIEL